MRELGDARRVGHRADGVRGERERDDPRALVDQALERVEVEIEVGLDDVELVHDQATILRDEQPRRDVRVVVEPGRDDLVARLERARDRVREQEVERRHVRAEGDLVGVAADEVGDRRSPGIDHVVRGSARAERAAEVRVVALEVAEHGVEHLARHLRAARPVEVGDEAPVLARGERGEASTDRGQVELRGHRRHGAPW